MFKKEGLKLDASLIWKVFGIAFFVYLFSGNSYIFIS